MQVPHAGQKRCFSNLSGSYPNGRNEADSYNHAPNQTAGVTIGWVTYGLTALKYRFLHGRLITLVCRAVLPAQSRQCSITKILSALFISRLPC